jgi:hypothetical protein
MQDASVPMRPKGAALWMRDVTMPLLCAAHPGISEYEAVMKCNRLWDSDEAYREYGYRTARAEATTYTEVIFWQAAHRSTRSGYAAHISAVMLSEIVNRQWWVVLQERVCLQPLLCCLNVTPGCSFKVAELNSRLACPALSPCMQHDSHTSKQHDSHTSNQVVAFCF